MEGRVWEGVIAGAIAIVFMLVYIKLRGKRDSSRLRKTCISVYLCMAAAIWSGCFIFYFADSGRPGMGLFVFHWISIPLVLVLWVLIGVALATAYRERKSKP